MTDWNNPVYKISESTKKKIAIMESGKKQYFVMPDSEYDAKFLPLSGSSVSAKIRKNKAIINYLPELYAKGPRFDSLTDARKYIFRYTLAGTHGKYGGGRIFCNKPHKIGEFDDGWENFCVESIGQNGYTIDRRTGEWDKKTLSMMHFSAPKKGTTYNMSIRSFIIGPSGKIIGQERR